MLGFECVLRRICISGCLKALENGLLKVSMTLKHAVAELKANLNGKSSVCCDSRKKESSRRGSSFIYSTDLPLMILDSRSLGDCVTKFLNVVEVKSSIDERLCCTFWCN